MLQIITWLNFNTSFKFPFNQVETVLFPDLKEKNLYLRSVDVNESVVQDIIQKALNIVKANAIGPQKYFLKFSFSNWIDLKELLIDILSSYIKLWFWLNSKIETLVCFCFSITRLLFHCVFMFKGNDFINTTIVYF